MRKRRLEHVLCKGRWWWATVEDGGQQREAARMRPRELTLFRKREPQPQQATWEPVTVELSVTVTLTVRQTVSLTVSVKACRSVAQALDHEGKGGATGTEGVGDP